MENEEKQEYSYNDAQEVKETGIEHNEEPFNPTPKRPGALTFVLILSMIGSGWSILMNLMSAITRSVFGTMMENGDSAQLTEKISTMYSDTMGIDPAIMAETMERFMEIPSFYYVITAILYIASLVGVIMMWKMRKTGFHVYTLAQLLVLLMTAMLGKAYIGMGDIMMTLLFVAFYAVNFFKKTDYSK